MALAFSRYALRAGHQVRLSNSRGPESLKDVVKELGTGASAGHRALAQRWIHEALARLQKLDYRADVVMNGLQVLETLKSLPYDLILMDWQMPELDEYQTTRAIRQREQS